MNANTTEAACRNRRGRWGDEGFSLIELLISVTLLGVGILSLAGLFPLAMQRVASGDLESRATFHAQAKIEELKRVPWDELVMYAGADTVETAFRRVWNVQEDEPVVGMKQVDVTVTWGDRKGPRNVTLSSFLSDSGM
jgi:prepilin-type N-terminal cleavage/methylation domain-containing protein